MPKNIMVKFGGTGAPGLGHPLAQPGPVRHGKTAVFHIQISDVPDEIAPADVMLALNDVTIFMGNQKKPAAFIVSWDEILTARGRIINRAG